MNESLSLYNIYVPDTYGAANEQTFNVCFKFHSYEEERR